MSGDDYWKHVVGGVIAVLFFPVFLIYLALKAWDRVEARIVERVKPAALAVGRVACYPFYWIGRAADWALS